MKALVFVFALVCNVGAMENRGLRALDDIKEKITAKRATKADVGASTGWGNNAKGFGSNCGLFAPCEEGLSCHPLIHKCYHYPRQFNERCEEPHYGCAEQSHKVPARDDFTTAHHLPGAMAPDGNGALKCMWYDWTAGLDEYGYTIDDTGKIPYQAVTYKGKTSGGGYYCRLACPDYCGSSTACQQAKYPKCNCVEPNATVSARWAGNGKYYKATINLSLPWSDPRNPWKLSAAYVNWDDDDTTHRWVSMKNIKYGNIPCM